MDAFKDVSTDINAVSVTTPTTTLDATINDSWTVDNLTARLAPLGEVRWDISQPTGALIYTRAIPADILNNAGARVPLMQSTLAMFHYYKADFIVHITFEGSAYYSGRVIIATDPLGTISMRSKSSTNTNIEDVKIASASTFVDMDISTDTKATLDVPFQSQYEMLTTQSNPAQRSSAFLSNILVYVLCPLKSATAEMASFVKIRFFAEGKNMQVNMQRFPISPVLEYTKTRTVGPNTYRVKPQATKIVSIDPVSAVKAHDIITTPAIHSTKGDPYDLYTYISAPSLVDSFTWGPTTRNGTLHVMHVHPLVNSSASLDRVYHSRLAHVTSAFNFWSGSLNYHFTVAASGNHQGRFGVAFVPFVTPNALDTDDLQTYSHVIFDINESHDFSVNVKFISPTAYASTTSGRDDLADVGAKSIGNLVFFEVNAIRSNFPANDEITINVYVSAGHDFVLTSQRQIRDVKAEFYPQGFQQPISMDYGPGFCSPISIGRVPLIINELARNYGMAWTINASTDSSGLLVPVHFAGSAGNNASMASFGASIFAAWKGDLKFRFTFSGVSTNRTGGGHVVYAWHEPKKNVRLPSFVVPGTFGGLLQKQMIVTSETSVLEIEIPYAARYSSLLTDVNSEVSLNQIFNGCIELVFAPAFRGNIFVEVATGDNFQFQIPVAPVPLIYQSAPLSLAVGPKITETVKPGAITAIAQSRGSLFKRKEVVASAVAQSAGTEKGNNLEELSFGLTGITALLSKLLEHIKVDTILSLVVGEDTVNWQDILKNLGLVLSMLAAAAIQGKLTDIGSLKSHIIILVSTLWSPFLIHHGLEVVPIILLLWENTLLPIYHYFIGLLGFGPKQSDTPFQVRKGVESRTLSVMNIFRPLAYGFVMVISLVVGKTLLTTEKSAYLVNLLVKAGEAVTLAKDSLLLWAHSIVSILRGWIISTDTEQSHEAAMVVLEETMDVSSWLQTIAETQDPNFHASFTTVQYLHFLWKLQSRGLEIIEHESYKNLEADTQIDVCNAYGAVYELAEYTYHNLDPGCSKHRIVVINIHGKDAARNAFVADKLSKDMRSYFEFQAPASQYEWNLNATSFKGYCGQPIVLAKNIESATSVSRVNSLRQERRISLGSSKSGEFISEFIITTTTRDAMLDLAQKENLFDILIEADTSKEFEHDLSSGAYTLIASKFAILSPKAPYHCLHMNDDGTEKAENLTYKRAMVETLVLCENLPVLDFTSDGSTEVLGRSILNARYQKGATSPKITAKAQGKRQFDVKSIFCSSGIMEALHVFLGVHLRDFPSLNGSHLSEVASLLCSMDFLAMYNNSSLEFYENTKLATLFCSFNKSEQEKIVQVAKSFVDWLFSAKKTELVISSCPLEHRSTVCNIISTGKMEGDSILFAEEAAGKWVASLDSHFRGRIVFASRIYHQESSLRTKLIRVGVRTSAYFVGFKNQWTHLSTTTQKAIKVTGVIVACATVIGMVQAGLSFYRTEPEEEEVVPTVGEVCHDIAGYLNPALDPIAPQSDGPFVSRSDARPRNRRNAVQYGSSANSQPIEWVSAQKSSLSGTSASAIATAFEFDTLPSVKAQYSSDVQAMALSSGTYANALGQMLLEIDPTRAEYGPLLCCVFIGFDLVLLPGHAMINLKPGDKFYLEDGIKTYALLFDPANVFRVGDTVKDAIIYRCGKTVAAHSKIFQHFITNKDVENYKGGSGTLLGVKMAQGKRFIMNTQLGKIERIDHTKTRVAYNPGSEAVTPHVLAKGWQYPARALEGDCGSLLVRHNPNKSTKLMGFHVASDMSGVTGYAEIVTQEDIEFTLRKMDAESNDPASIHSNDLLEKIPLQIEGGVNKQGPIAASSLISSVQGENREKVENFLLDYFSERSNKGASVDMISTVGYDIVIESHVPINNSLQNNYQRFKSLREAKAEDCEYFDNFICEIGRVNPMKLTRKEVVFAWVRTCLHLGIEPTLNYMKIVRVDSVNPTV